MIDLNQILATADERVTVGNFFVAQGFLDTGLSLFRAALDVDPEHIHALCNSAYILITQKQLSAADMMLAQVLKQEPENSQALGHKAILVQEMDMPDKWQRAREFFNRSITSDPKDGVRLLNYAYMLQLVGDYAGALESYNTARDLNVLNLSGRFQRAMCLLTLADTPAQWQDAWDEYEIRRLIYSMTIPNRGKPLYTGQAVGQFHPTLLIVCEQGIGDAVMTARYVRFLKEDIQFEKVYMLCNPGWDSLLDRVHGINGVYTNINQVPSYDFWIPAMGLMRAESWPEVKPSNAPYLAVNHFPGRLAGYADPRKLKIGICYQGNPEHGNDKYRSINPELFTEAFSYLSHCANFYSLQQAHVPGRPAFTREVSIETLDRLADVISDMDLIITVDTAILHIAGAMGVPVYGMLATNPDWRWGLNSATTDWYPSVTLFRADKPLEWKPVLDLVRQAVDHFIFMKEIGA